MISHCDHFVSSVVVPSKGAKRNKVNSWLEDLVYHILSFNWELLYTLISSKQGGNIFAALSQGQSDDDEEDEGDDDEDEKIAKNKASVVGGDYVSVHGGYLTLSLFIASLNCSRHGNMIGDIELVWQNMCIRDILRIGVHCITSLSFMILLLLLVLLMLQWKFV